MASIRSCATGDGGFTLLELLVVLAMIGLLTALAPPLLSQARGGLEISTVARQLAQLLRAARTDAVTAERTVAVDMQVEGHRRRVAAEPGGAELILPAGLAVSASGDGARFFADGSANPVVLRLSGGGRTRRITVLPLSGRVVIDE